MYLVGGFSPTPLKNDGVKVSWDDEIPNIWKVIKFHGSKPPTRYINVHACISIWVHCNISQKPETGGHLGTRFPAIKRSFQS